MPEPDYTTKHQPADYEQRGLVDQVLVPSATAFSGGVGVGLGGAAGDIIKDKLKLQTPPPEDK
jgi:hypothetical protein